jgi:hypothetical protein
MNERVRSAIEARASPTRSTNGRVPMRTPSICCSDTRIRPCNNIEMMILYIKHNRRHAERRAQAL